MDQALTNDQIVISGELLHDAQVRTVPMGEDATSMPVLCLLIKADNSCHGPVQAQQVYPAELRDEALRIAKTMKKGLRVTVNAPLAHLKVTLAMASKIDIHGRAKQAKTTTTKEAAHA